MLRTDANGGAGEKVGRLLRERRVRRGRALGGAVGRRRRGVIDGGGVRGLGPGRRCDLSSGGPLLLMIERNRMTRVGRRGRGRARRRPRLLLRLLLGTARDAGRARRGVGRGGGLVLARVVSLLRLGVRGRQLRARGARDRLQEAHERLLAPADTLDDGRGRGVG